MCFAVKAKKTTTWQPLLLGTLFWSVTYIAHDVCVHSTGYGYLAQTAEETAACLLGIVGFGVGYIDGDVILNSITPIAK